MEAYFAVFAVFAIIVGNCGVAWVFARDMKRRICDE